MSTCEGTAGLYYLILNLSYFPEGSQLYTPAALLPLCTHYEGKNCDLCQFHNYGDLIGKTLWICNIARVVEIRSTYRITVGKPESNELGRLDRW